MEEKKRAHGLPRGGMRRTTLFPLHWLAGNVPLLLVYCGILVIAVVDLRAKVCGDCKNVFCVLKKRPVTERRRTPSDARAS
jgi:hypothetical protein